MLMLSRLQQSSRVSFSFSVTRNLMMWVRLFGLSLWIVGVIFSVFLASISLQSFGRHCEKAAQNIDRTSANGSKQKAGFGEGTPQQVRPVSETQFQLLKLWPQVDTCLSLFLSKMKIQISNWILVSKAGSAGVKKCLLLVVAACTESAFLPLCCSGVVRLARILCGVMARYPDPDGSYGFQSSGMKNCR